MSFTVTLFGGSPWGFRFQGGFDKSEVVRISKINPGSKASQQGLKEGDVIEAINAQSTCKLTQNESYDLIRSAEDQLQLVITRDETVSPRMFKSSKSIELNGTNHTNSREKSRFKDDTGKTNSVPSSPISITLSSSKKAVFNQSMEQTSVNNPTSECSSSTNRHRGGRSDKTPTIANPNSAPTTPTTPVTQNSEGIWSPGQPPPPSLPTTTTSHGDRAIDNVKIAPVWTPYGQHSSTGKQFRSIRMERTTSKEMHEEVTTNVTTPPVYPPPLEPIGTVKTGEAAAKSNPPELPSKRSVPVTGAISGASQLSPPFNRVAESHLPRSQSPTITLLQKAREGQIPKGASYIDSKDKPDSFSEMPRVNDALFRVKSAEIGHDYRKLQLEPIQHEGIGPTTPQGVPISLRTGIKEENKGEWYKKMYKSLHRLGDSSEDDYVVVKYRRRGRIPYSSSGYMSEPEPDRDDYSRYKYATLDRRRPRFDEYDHNSKTLPPSTKTKPVFPTWSPPSAKYSSDVYRNQPRRIEEYEPGYSSIAEREAKLDDDSVGKIDTASADVQQTLSMIGSRSSDISSASYSFKDGYESDSTLVYKKHEFGEQPSPLQQRSWYREIQKGGDIPLSGFRRPAPDKIKDLPPLKLTRSVSSDHATGIIDFNTLPPVPAPPPKVPLVEVGPDSPHRYQESEVNIHYKTPVRSLEKEYIEEEELRVRQEEMMKEFYEEEKRKKFIQELNDVDNRRHSDNFMPSQKSPIPLDRYDNPFDPPASPVPRGRTPEPKIVARAKFNFVAQNARELSFSKSDVIFINRRIDKNWYEGEHHGMIGLFPVNYVEIIPYDNIRSTPKKISEGIAKAKYNFHAQSSVEMPLVKGEMVVLTRRVDRNWYMGRVGAREGIMPVSYLDVAREPGEIPSSPVSPAPKPVASPVSRALVMNGSALSPTMQYNDQSYLRKKNILPGNYPPAKRYLPNRPPEPYTEKKQPVNQSLHIDTHSEPVPYRALYEYHPQNEDELQLNEGDTVFVMEKCDDGWYVGSSLRTGFFGTFPGNYVERL